MRKFFQVIVTWALVIAAGVGILWYLGYIKFSDGDDRPPVVVSSGSIQIESQFDANDESRGRLDPLAPGDKKKWLAVHDKGKPPKKVSVIIDGSTTTSPECRPTNVHKNVTKVTFSYVPTAASGIPNQFTASITANGLEFHLPVDAEQTAATNFRVTIPAVTLRSVTIDGTTCDLGARGEVELRQRK
jgi:hypothetical protein